MAQQSDFVVRYTQLSLQPLIPLPILKLLNEAGVPYFITGDAFYHWLLTGEISAARELVITYNVGDIKKDKIFFSQNVRAVQKIQTPILMLRQKHMPSIIFEKDYIPPNTHPYAFRADQWGTQAYSDGTSVWMFWTFFEQGRRIRKDFPLTTSPL